MIALLFVLAFSGPLSGHLTMTRSTDADYGVVCYTLIELYRGVVGFSCVHVTEPVTLQSKDLAEIPENDLVPRKERKEADVAR